MRLERVIASESNESTVRERVAAYFALSGYSPLASEPHLMSYQRGKFFTLTAKGCKTNAVIHFFEGADQKTQVTVTIEIDTTGQWVTERERKYWQQQMDDIEHVVLKGMEKSESKLKGGV